MAVSAEYCWDHLNQFSNSLNTGNPEWEDLLKANDIYDDTHESSYYYCPLCCKQIVFAKRVDDHFEINQSTEFTKDHFPPQAVGGDQTILICKTCNNTAGHNFEDELTYYINYRNFSKGKIGSAIKGGKGRFEGATDGPYNISLTLTDTQMPHLQFHNSKSSVLLIKKIEEMSRGLKTPLEIFTKQPDSSMVRSSILKTMYLYCFKQWGYGFVFSKSAIQLRDVIWNKAEYPSMNGINFIHEENIDGMPIGPVAISSVGLKTLLVNIPVKLENGYRCIIGSLIPEPDDNGFQKMKQLLIENQNKTFQTPFIKILPFDINSDFYGYQSAWYDLKNNLIS